jgi:hypothetical protein
MIYLCWRQVFHPLDTSLNSRAGLVPLPLLTSKSLSTFNLSMVLLQQNALSTQDNIQGAYVFQQLLPL